MSKDDFKGLSVGDVVRVRDPRCFLASFSRKIADRDATVLSLFESDWGDRAKVRFHKRGSRGTEFEEMMRVRDLVRLADLRDAGASTPHLARARDRDPKGGDACGSGPKD